MFRELTNIVYDKDFRISLFENKVNINNYKEILIFEDDVILVKTDQKLVKVKGSNLVINKLYNKELLILGEIKSIELG